MKTSEHEETSRFGMVLIFVLAMCCIPLAWSGCEMSLRSACLHKGNSPQSCGVP